MTYVGEDLGGVLSLGEGGEGSRTGVDARQSNREDREADGDVNEVLKSLDTREGSDKDERRNITARFTTLKIGVGVRDCEADHGKGGDVDDDHTPESLLDGGGEGLPWVGRLGSGETNELCTGERESGGDEYLRNQLFCF